LPEHVRAPIVRVGTCGPGAFAFEDGDDRVDTDVPAGLQVGMETVLVPTWLTAAADVEPVSVPAVMGRAFDRGPR